MNLSKFEVYKFSTGVSTMTISKSGISFSQTAVIRLEMATHVRLLINQVDKEIAIQQASSEDKQAMRFYRARKNAVTARWNYKDLIATLSDLMGWNTDEHTYKVTGEFNASEKLILFKLGNAEMIS